MFARWLVRKHENAQSGGGKAVFSFSWGSGGLTGTPWEHGGRYTRLKESGLSYKANQAGFTFWKSHPFVPLVSLKAQWVQERCIQGLQGEPGDDESERALYAFSQWFSGLDMHLNYLKGLWKQISGPHLQSFWLGRLERSPRTCIFNKFSGDDDGPETTLWDPQLQSVDN